MSARLSPRDRVFWTSRSLSFIGICALHALGLAVGLAMRGPQRDAADEAQPIQVAIISESRPGPTEQQELKVSLQEVSVPQAVAPITQITLPDEPAPTAITVAAVLPASDPVVNPVNEAGPVTVSEPDYLQMPQPVYPAAAKRARAQGVVHVRALVDVEGKPQETTVARTSGYELLDRAACEAVRRALFKPYRRNNVARSMLVIVPVEFSLKSAINLTAVALRPGR